MCIRDRAQLCTSTIIRDEQIAALSLDLNETDRYRRVYDALGATDPGGILDRGTRVLNATKARSKAAEREANTANAELAQASRRVDELRASLIEDDVLASAVSRLRELVLSQAPQDQLVGLVRVKIADMVRRESVLARVASSQIDIAAKQEQAETNQRSLIALRDTQRDLEKKAEDTRKTLGDGEPSSAIAQQARDLAALVAIGRRLGLQPPGHCPLCATEQDHLHFADGLRAAEDAASSLSTQAAERGRQEEELGNIRQQLSDFERQIRELDTRREVLETELRQHAADLESVGLAPDAGSDQIAEIRASLAATIEAVRDDLRVLETVTASVALERAVHAEQAARVGHVKAEERLGRMRRAEMRAQSIADATRRAAGETVSRRLERVLPLMSELYSRLRPHPIWSDIDYKIRGDVRRFLKLEVGNELNPQFIFSSGQRRATGLAFLLAVNLSLAWSRWKSILLDDPVQHVDDFRSVHLAEVLAQLVAGGRQIVCAVEDPALADLLCRRLPVMELGQARRISLGVNKDGALVKTADTVLPPLAYRALVHKPVQHVS